MAGAMMRGVQRTVAVFECFTPERLSLTLQEISDSIRLPKSTTFRVVQSLEEAGYLIRLEDQKYCLSLRFTRLAGMVMSTLSIRHVARPMMVELARRTNETIALNMASGRDRICIDSIDTPAPLMSMARPGQSLPLDHKGATEKTLMAHLPQKELEKLVGQLAKGNARRRAEMLAELARVRKDGYCITHGERVLGLSAIAAPIRDSSDAASYCVSLTAPTVRMKPNINELLKLLLGTTSDISRRLGADMIPTTMRSPDPGAKKTAHRPRARAPVKMQ
jgi:DNA-binding IclR family transcriptional regulator